MTVKELIERLETVDGNAKIIVIDAGFDDNEIESISTDGHRVMIYLE